MACVARICSCGELGFGSLCRLAGSASGSRFASRPLPACSMLGCSIPGSSRLLPCFDDGLAQGGSVGSRLSKSELQSLELCFAPAEPFLCQWKVGLSACARMACLVDPIAGGLEAVDLRETFPIWRGIPSTSVSKASAVATVRLQGVSEILIFPNAALWWVLQR